MTVAAAPLSRTLYIDPDLGRIAIPAPLLRSRSLPGGPARPLYQPGEVGIFVTKQHRPVFDERGRLRRMQLIWADISHNERVDKGAVRQDVQMFGTATSGVFTNIAVASASLSGRAKGDLAMGSTVANDGGTATSGAATTLTDTGKAWGTNAYTNAIVTITSGTGNGQTRTVASNTATVLTVSSAWTTNPDTTSVYNLTWNEFTTLGLARAAGTLGAYTAPASLGGQFSRVLSKVFTATGAATAYGASLWDSLTISSGNLYVEDNYSNGNAILANADTLTVSITISN